MTLAPFFTSKTIAVIGASREEGKIGHTILRQLMGRNFTLYPVNPNAKDILGLTCYESILQVPARVELAVICTPGELVPKILDQCGKKGIKHVIIISAGFKEVGNLKLQKDLEDKLKAHNILCIGPNCLGVFDAHTKLDTLFLPSDRLKRPRAGGISFISQSGATGSAVLDLSAHENYGFAKFVSYGNAANVDESDLLSYLNTDHDTRVICMYIEGVKDGAKFLAAARASKKPIIVLKGGTSSEGSKAAQSHTGSLAGDSDIYFGAFKQAGIVIAHTLEELFEYAKIFDKLRVSAAGNRTHIITNGGGYGILTADAVHQYALTLAKEGKHLRALSKQFPSTVVLHNPTDILGDATNERYELALDAVLRDIENDCLIVIVLTQVPLVSEHIVDVLERSYKKSHKPFVVVVTGSDYSERIRFKLEDSGIPCYTFPENAVRALSVYVRYSLR